MTAPVAMSLAAFRRAQEDAYFARPPFPVAEVPFSILLLTDGMGTAPPRRPWEPLEDWQRDAAHALRQAQRATRRRLRVAGLALRGDRLIDGDTAVATVEVVESGGLFRPLVRRCANIPRRPKHPVIRAAQVALAGAWWRYVPQAPDRMEPIDVWGVWTGEMDIAWTDHEFRTRREANERCWGRYQPDVAARFRRHVAAEAAAREAARPLNGHLRDVRDWRKATVNLITTEGEPWSASARVWWPFCVRGVALTHLPSGFVVCRHADPAALRRLAEAVADACDWDWRRPTPPRMRSLAAALDPFMPFGARYIDASGRAMTYKRLHARLRFRRRVLEAA